MSHLIRAFRAALAVPLVCLPALVHADTGYTPGSFSVSPTGAANHTIPIAVPPGSAGMQPSLSLVYNSQSGNGLVGMGFSLQGLSAITRCPQTMATDGNAGGVSLNAFDRYCLDGQRLIAINGSLAYNAAGQEYRTERDTFAQIIAVGQDKHGSGPLSFSVKTKSGQTIYYGGSADAQVADINNRGEIRHVITWATNQITDTLGNYIAIHYCNDNTPTYCTLTPGTGEYYPVQIDYAANDTQGVPASSSVKLIYAARTDTFTGYIGGAKISNTVRLANIQVFEGTNIIRDYRLTYDPNQANTMTGRSRLTALTECDSSLSSANCLPATTFGWSTDGVGFNAGTPISTGITSDSSHNVQAIDVNADGKADLTYCTSSSGTWQVALSTGYGFATPYNTSIPCGNYTTATPIDYNSDGKMDLIIRGSLGGSYTTADWYVLQSTGGSFSVIDTKISTAQPTAIAQALDMNGDGRQDVLDFGYGDSSSSSLCGGGNVIDQYGLMNGSAGLSTGIHVGYACYTAYMVPYFNAGTGHWQALITGSLTGTNWEVVSYNTSFAVSDSGIPSTGAANNPQAIDVNGDGRSDLVYSDGTNWNIRFNVGAGVSGFGTATSTYIPAAKYQYTRQIDYNGDGKTDLLWPGPWGTSYPALNWYLMKSTGTGFTVIDTGIPNTGAANNPQVADFNGDGLPDLLYYNASWQLRLHNVGNNGLPDQLTSITNGLGARTAIVYKPLSDNTICFDGGGVFPQQNFRGPVYVVSQYTTSDGLGKDDYAVTYKYWGPSLNVQGRGFLGFGLVVATDARTGIDARTYYSQTWPYTGLVTVTYQILGGATLRTSINTLANFRYGSLNAYYYLPYVAQATQKTYELSSNGGALITSASTSNTYHASCATSDAYCDLTTITAATVDNMGNTFTKTTNNTYDYSGVSNWILGRLTDVTVTSTTPMGVSRTRESSFTYYPSGLLQTEVIEPNGNTTYGVNNLTQTTTYTYDGFGNKTGATVTGADITPRTVTAGDNANSSATSYLNYNAGRFETSLTNTVSQGETRVYDARFGTVATLTGPNGLSTNWQYDNFGRKMLETRADGTTSRWTYNPCSTGCPGLAKYYVMQTTDGAPTVTVYYDLLDREVRSQTVGYGGATIYKDTAYNAKGQIDHVSRPYYYGDTPWWTYYGYDALGRVTTVSLPTQAGAAGTSLATTTYNGLTTSVTAYRDSDGALLTTTQVKDAIGELTSVTDANGAVTSYLYDPFGNLTQVTDPANNLTKMSYDIRGRKLTMSDPDMGGVQQKLWQYSYDTVGELIAQVDAKGQTVTMTYDSLGRLATRTEPEHPGSPIVYTYDDTTLSGPAAKGKLSKIAWLDGNNASNTRSFVYDNFGRPIQETTNLAGTVLTMKASYDALGRVSKITYPSNYVVQNNYEANGYLQSVSDAVTGYAYWSAPSYAADGQYLAYTLGNGLMTVNKYDGSGRLTDISTGPTASSSAIQYLSYHYDSLGNLKDRVDVNQASRTETFSYDPLNRLKTTTIAGVGSKSFGYDSIGNLTGKSDVGTGIFKYGSQCAGANAGPHALCNDSTGTTNYAYDSNGNQVSGPGRSISWSSFNQPLTIAINGRINTFVYDPDHLRVIETTSDGTTYFVHPRMDTGARYEEVRKPDGSIEHKNFIYAGKEFVAIYTNRSTGVNDTRYYHKDHLGSVDTITNESGSVVNRLSYDAWGKRRNSNWADWSLMMPPIVSISHHGFTGHEHLDDVGLINMNGRVYDPTVGRFISADPTVQNPGNLQNLNRYSYAGNNPLTNVDPSGYGWNPFKAIVNIFKVVVAIVAIVAAVYILGPYAALQMGFVHGTVGFAVASGMVGGFAAGFAATYMATGDPRAALYGGMTGAIMGGIGGYTSTWGDGIGGTTSKVIAKSMGGGVSSVLQGGKFDYGFKMTAFNESMSMVYQSLAEMTDKLGQAAADGKEMPRDGFGSVRTDGTTSVFSRAGKLLRDGAKSLFKSLNITMSSQSDPNSHWYKDIPLVPEMINAVSKVHDAMNAWNYDFIKGGYIDRGYVLNTGFDAYSFAGMLPAAAFTVVAAPVQVQGGGATLALELEYHRRD